MNTCDVRVRKGGRLCHGPPFPLEALRMGLLVYRRFPAYAFLNDDPHRAPETEPILGRKPNVLQPM